MQDSLDLAYYFNVVKSRYFNIVKRRFPLFLLPFVLVSAAGFTVALLLPSIYLSSATLLIQSQKIPKEFVQSTVASLADERVQVIGQRTLTRDNLLRIVDKFSLFDDRKALLSPTELVDEMLGRIKIEHLALALQRRRRRGPSMIAFKVSFEHEIPHIAAKVAGELVTVILNEDATMRISRASETTKFLKKQSQRLEKELITIEKQISELRNKYRDALPENLDIRLKLLDRAQAELEAIDRQISAALGSGPTSAAPSLQHLALLKAELTTKSAIYANSHPEIKGLRRKILAFEKKVGMGLKKQVKKAAPPSDPAAALKNAENKQHADALVPLTLSSLRDKLEKKISSLKKSVDQTPEVKLIIQSVSRKYENKKQQYEDLINKQQKSLLSEKLEEDKQGERLEVIEQPVVPKIPIKPNRLKISGLALFLAFAIGVGSVLAVEIFDRRIWSSADLIKYLEYRPLVTIPYITTCEEMRVRRKQTRRLQMAGVISVVLVVFGIHFLYMPLDLLFMKVITRFQIQ